MSLTISRVLCRERLDPCRQRRKKEPGAPVRITGGIFATVPREGLHVLNGWHRVQHHRSCLMAGEPW